MEKVKSKMEWLRSIQLGETKTGIFKNPKDCNTMSVLICRWNIEEGLRKGIRISAIYDRYRSKVTITANPL